MSESGVNFMIHKSGTKVVSADVNLVNAIINANAQKTIYITFNKFGKNPKTDDASIAIKIKNNPINTYPTGE